MSQNPDSMTAMQNIIMHVKRALPLKDPATFVCGLDGNCIGCPKNYWSWLIASCAIGKALWLTVILHNEVILVVLPNGVKM